MDSHPDKMANHKAAEAADGSAAHLPKPNSTTAPLLSQLLPQPGRSAAPTPAAGGMTSLYGRLRSMHPASAAVQQPAQLTTGEAMAQSEPALSTTSSGATGSGPFQPQKAAPTQPLLQYSLFSKSSCSSSAGCSTSCSSGSVTSHSTASSIYAGDSFSTGHKLAAADAAPVATTAAAPTGPGAAAAAATAEFSALLEALGLSAAAQPAAQLSFSLTDPPPSSSSNAIDFGSLVTQLQQLYVDTADPTSALPPQPTAGGNSSSSRTAAGVAPTAAAVLQAPGGFDFVQQQLLCGQLRELQQQQLLRTSASNSVGATDVFGDFGGLGAAATAATVPPAALNNLHSLFADQQQQQHASGLQLPGIAMPTQFPAGDAMNTSLLSLQQQQQQQQMVLAQLMSQLGSQAACSSSLTTCAPPLSPSPFSSATFAANLAATDMAMPLPASGPASVAAALAALQHKMVLGPHAPFTGAGSAALSGSMAAALAAAAAAGGCVGMLDSSKQTLQLGPGSNPMYKTELCRTWIETGGCRYGSRCQFAHGPKELRPVLRHPKYKTQPCRTFSIQGSCPYGDRCNFIHDQALKSSNAGSRLLLHTETSDASSGSGSAVAGDSRSACSSPMEAVLSL